MGLEAAVAIATLVGALLGVGASWGVMRASLGHLKEAVAGLVNSLEKLQSAQAAQSRRIDKTEAEVLKLSLKDEWDSQVRSLPVAPPPVPASEADTRKLPPKRRT